MRILMVLEHSFPPDVRVENEIESLTRAGHQVHILCAQRDKQASYEVGSGRLRGLSVHRITPSRRLSSGRRRLVTALFLAKWIDIRWLVAIRRLVARHDIDAIHVHDLPLLPTSVAAARRRRVPVVADLHENYPMAVPFYAASWNLSFFGRLRYSGKRWARVERRILPKCSHVIVVVDEMRARIEALGIDPNRITVVENLVEPKSFLGTQVAPMRHSPDLTITYVGGFGPHRGLDTVIRALPLIRAEEPSTSVVLVGDGMIRGELEHLVRELDLQSNVSFVGHQPMQDVPAYIAGSDVGLIPHVRSVQTDAALPHKLFQYMLLRKPVVASSCPSVARIVEETRSGVVFEAGNPASLASAVLSLRDPKLRAELGANGAEAVTLRYNWATSERRLLEIYGRPEVATRKPGKSMRSAKPTGRRVSDASSPR